MAALMRSNRSNNNTLHSHINGRGSSTHNNINDDEANKGNRKSYIQRIKAQLVIYTCCFLLACTLMYIYSSGSQDATTMPKLKIKVAPPSKALPGRIIYGAKSKGDDTAKLVKQAIQSGFRHIATGGFHNEYNESGVGEGWKSSGISRHELYLQTLFLHNSVNGYATQNCHLPDVCPPSPDLSIEQQVRISIKSSLYNLQTDYIDAVLVHNFRAKLQPYEETIQVWRVLEEYVDKGTIRHLGIVSVHDKEYLTKLYNEARIKPTIIQNRFHSNRGYDISLRPLFKELNMSNQLFWILTGSAGGRIRNNDVVKELAQKMGGVSPQILLYSFTMELGGSPLIGSKSISHMQDDVNNLIRNSIRWKKDDLIAMANVINKNLIS